MSNKLECRLPPINSLSLDFPLSLPQPFHTQAQNYHGTQTHFHGLPLAGNFATVPQAGNSHLYHPQVVQHHLMATPVLQHSSLPHFHAGLAEYTVSKAASGYDTPASGSFSAQSASFVPANGQMKANMHPPAPLLQQPSPSSSRRSSSPSPLADKIASPKRTVSDADPSVFATAEASKSPEMAKDVKRRKKRQCPECHLFFSNLATHKSTHLNPTARPHVCTVCNRGFARPNDLFRHYKCHWKETGTGNGQFKCPFKSSGGENHCSHSSGIFSRCDTYKNHLKAIHFDYPGGTRKSERATSAGRCGSCQQQFSTVEEWLTTHVDTHSCEYMKT